jgi:uncharacterized DUF497 family protein
MDELTGVEIERLFWDDWNREHIARHGVSPHEVEEAVFNRPVVRRSYKNRFVVVGPTLADPPRMITAVIGEDPKQPGVYYPFTAHLASRTERRRYQEATQGGEPT